MGIKGLYSCLKMYSVKVSYEAEEPTKFGLDAYPFLYKFREDIDACLALFKKMKDVGHTLTVYMDGMPPKEKIDELTSRKQQKESAFQQAKALREFLDDKEKSAELNDEARKVLEKQVQSFETESWSLRREIRESFLRRCREELSIDVILCEGEADNDLIKASLEKRVDIIIANDMDLFVGGVERLWMLGKTNAEPLFMEFRRSDISRDLGIHPRAWTDVALLTGYEKAQVLRRCSAQQAIVWIRFYGCLENLFSRRPDLLRENTVEEYQKAREFFSV